MGLLPAPREEEARHLQRSPLLLGEAADALPRDLVEDDVGAAADVDLLHEAVPLALDFGALEDAADAGLEEGDGRRGGKRAQRRAEALVDPPRADDPGRAEQQHRGPEPQ